jgi:signal transduction histidine kinase
MGLGRLSEAEDLLMKAYEATKDVKDNSQISVFYNRGQLYLKKGDYEKALNFNNQIIGRYTVQEDPSGVLMLKKQRAEIMLQSHQFEEAADLYKQVFFLSDSLNIKDVKNQLNEFNALYKVDEMERETQQVKTRQVYIVLGVIIIALVLMGMLGLYFMNRLRQKNRELALALDHSKESDRMKTAFIQHVSHEIRTPLNIITGFSQVIGNPDYHLNGEERRNIVNSIETNTREITSFVNELLIFSEVESQNNYKLEDCVNVYLFCQGLLERVEAVNNGRLEIAYESQLDDKHTVVSNLKALEGILRPLLSNALKFTERGSVKLQVRKGEDSSMLDICVTDTGIGIPEDQRDRIFEKFYKVDSFKRGLGLGLPLARSIAQKINGDLMLDDTYKEGTRFILRIPDNHT